MYRPDFPLLKQGNQFDSFKEFQVLFLYLQKMYNLKYKSRSTKYIVNDKKFQGKSYNANIIYSEYHVQCTKKSIDIENGITVQCPSEIKLFPRDNYQKLELVVYKNEHNHEINKICDDQQLDRIEVVEKVVSKLAALLLNIDGNELTNKLELLQKIMDHDATDDSSLKQEPKTHLNKSTMDKGMESIAENISVECEVQYFNENNNHHEIEQSEIEKETFDEKYDNMKSQMKVSKESYKLSASKSKENVLESSGSNLIDLPVNELDSESSSNEFLKKPTYRKVKNNPRKKCNLQLKKKDQANFESKVTKKKSVPIINDSSSDNSNSYYNNKIVTDKFMKKDNQQQNDNVVNTTNSSPVNINKTGTVKKIDTQIKNAAIKKNNTIKKTVVHCKRTVKPTYKVALLKSLKKTEKKFTPAVYSSHSNDDSDDVTASKTKNNINFKSQKTESKMKSKDYKNIAFVNTNKSQKVKKMLQWLNVPENGIQSSLKFENRIKVNDLSECISHAFKEVCESDFKLLRKYCTEEAFESLHSKVSKIKKHNDTVCNVCNTEQSNSNKWICCEACLLWFHYECVGVTEPPIDDWLCNKQKCVTKNY